MYNTNGGLVSLKYYSRLQDTRRTKQYNQYSILPPYLSLSLEALRTPLRVYLLS